MTSNRVPFGSFFSCSAACMVAQAVALAASAVSLAAPAPGGDCVVEIVALEDKCDFLQDQNGLELEVRCGAGVTVTNGQAFTVGGTINFAPGGIGATVVWNCSFTVATGFTITAENCEFCKGELCRANQKIKVTVCEGFWPWSDPKVTSEYIAGISTFSESCRSDNETRCYCKRKSKKCPCGIDAPPSESQSDLGTGTLRGAVSLEYSQVRGADRDERVATGIDDMCMLDVALFRRFFESIDLEPTTVDVAVVGSEGEIELHAVESFLAKLADREQVLVDGKRLDVNGDGSVDEQDMSIVLQSMGATVESGPFDYRADLDANGKVSEDDLQILQDAI